MPDRRHIAMAAVALAAAAAFLPTAAAEPTAEYPTDERGYTDSAARCDDDQTLVEFGRTSRALVAICVSSDGELQYRGVRLSDDAGLTMPATRSADGTITAVNDGVTYAVTPQMILVSEGDNVLYRDAWTEFHSPRFPSSPTTAASPTTATSPTTSASPTTTPASPTTTPASPTTTGTSTPESTSPPTVSTTTVTLTPTQST